MGLDLSGSYFGGADFGRSNMNAEKIMDTSSNAILYVFKPYQNQFRDVGLRPFTYHFDENFLNDTREINDLARRGSSSAPAMVSELMSSTNLSDHMIPSHQASMMLKASVLSDNYRFILVLTSKGNDLITGNTLVGGQSNNQVRRIYTGYFQDEPFNRTSFSHSKRTLNPNSFMVITHKTILGMTTSHDRLGPKLDLSTRASEEIIHPQLTRSLIVHNGAQDQGPYLMTPDNCINSIETTQDGYSLALPGAHSDISRDNGANVVADILEQPTHNVAQIVKGMIRFQEEVTHRDELGMYKVDRIFEDVFADDGYGRMKLGRFLNVARASYNSILDLDIDQRISPVDLDNMVGGHLDVVDFDLPRPDFYSTTDQMESSVTNQYSFLVASVISPILNSAGLNAIQFVYETARVNGLIDYNFTVKSAEPNWPVSNEKLMRMVKAVEVELRNGIFATIFSAMSDFHIAVSANVTGMTTVRLNLVGQGYRNYDDFELPSCLGGLVSPLIGDAVTNATNSEAIETLYNVATGTQNVATSFDDNDRDFMSQAMQIAQSHGWNPSDLTVD